jgi:hypothetical protein
VTVYELRTRSDRYANFAFWDQRDNARFQDFDGRSLARAWQPPAIKAADERDDSATLGDYALLGTIPVFSQRAVDFLGDMLRSNGELLPLLYGRAEYFAYNVTRLVPALDQSAAQLNRFADGNIMWVERYAFHKHIVGKLTIFKIPELARAYVFVTEPFVQRANAAHLTGISFKEVWSAAAEH